MYKSCNSTNSVDINKIEIKVNNFENQFHYAWLLQHTSLEKKICFPKSS